MIPRGDMNWSDWNNPRRLIRRIETSKHKGLRGDSLKALIIGLTAPLPVLYKRIDEGLERRLRSGMRVTGVNERAIARRQLVWFKKQKNIHWFDISQKGFEDDILRLINEQD